MNLNTLYHLAKQNGIRIDNFVLDENTNSLAVYVNNKYAIALDLNKLKTPEEIIVALAHELGHCLTHSFYNVKNVLDVRSKHEYTANKYAIKTLVPEGELLRAFKTSTQIWELAEHFGVTEDFMIKACEFYGYYHRAC